MTIAIGSAFKIEEPRRGYGKPWDETLTDAGDLGCRGAATVLRRAMRHEGGEAA